MNSNIKKFLLIVGDNVLLDFEEIDGVYKFNVSPSDILKITEIETDKKFDYFKIEGLYINTKILKNPTKKDLKKSIVEENFSYLYEWGIVNHLGELSQKI